MIIHVHCYIGERCRRKYNAHERNGNAAAEWSAHQRNNVIIYYSKNTRRLHKADELCNHLHTNIHNHDNGTANNTSGSDFPTRTNNLPEVINPVRLFPYKSRHSYETNGVVNICIQIYRMEHKSNTSGLDSPHDSLYQQPS